MRLHETAAHARRTTAACIGQPFERIARLRRGEVGDRPADQGVLVGDTEQLGRGGVGEDDSPAGVHDHRFRRHREQLAVARVGLAQRTKMPPRVDPRQREHAEHRGGGGEERPEQPGRPDGRGRGEHDVVRRARHELPHDLIVRVVLVPRDDPGDGEAVVRTHLREIDRRAVIGGHPDGDRVRARLHRRGAAAIARPRCVRADRRVRARARAARDGVPSARRRSARRVAGSCEARPARRSPAWRRARDRLDSA